MNKFLAIAAACVLYLSGGSLAHAVSVHDPSVIKVGSNYYIFGSHLAAAKSPDLVNWNRFAEGVNSSNPLFQNVTQELAEALSWAETNTLWAADVRRLPDGKFYMYYNACRGDAPLSALGVAVADNLEGPYRNKQILLRSGKGQSPTGVNFNATVHPNVVDPHVFFDKNNRLWMTYGSYSGGIFILELDPATGLIKPGQTTNGGYGKHLIGGNHSRIEAPFILYSPESNYYYLFVSFGGLAANGGYDIRVARSNQPDGPYLDAKGNDMRAVVANCALECGDASIQRYAQKLVGGHLFDRKSGDSGSGLGVGYVSPGHNSAHYEASTNQYFLFFHTRLPGQGENHEVRVHEMFVNDDDWLVAAPTSYKPGKPGTSITRQDVVGNYRMVNHGKNITSGYEQAQSISISLADNGSVTGGATGSWTFKNNNFIQVQINGQPSPFEGVLSRQWHEPLQQFVVTFTAQSRDGISLWGIRSGGMTAGNIANGTYRITPSHSNKALDAANCNSANGTSVQQWSWLNNDCQKWRVTHLGDGYYQIAPAFAQSKALDVANNITADGTNVQLWDYWGSQGQQFRFQSSGSGRWRIIARHSGKCLDINGASTANGSKLIQWTCLTNSLNQQFQLVRQ